MKKKKKNGEKRRRLIEKLKKALSLVTKFYVYRRGVKKGDRDDVFVLFEKHSKFAPEY